MGNLYRTTVYKGCVFERSLTLRDSNGDAVDLTGYSAWMQFRKSDGTLLKELTESSGITLGGEAGTLTWKVVSTDTNTWPTDEDVEFDLLLTPPGTGSHGPDLKLKGIASVETPVTRS